MPPSIDRDALVRLLQDMPGAERFRRFEEDGVTVFRHIGNSKWFGIVHTLHDCLCATLKMHPMESLIVRERYAAVEPGWHMNKLHWNTVRVHGDVPHEELLRMIRTSFDLTAPKLARRLAQKG